MAKEYLVIDETKSVYISSTNHYEYYDSWSGEYVNVKLDKPNTTTETDNDYRRSRSKTIIQVTATSLMWKYEYETDSGDVRTMTEAFTKTK